MGKVEAPAYDLAPCEFELDVELVRTLLELELHDVARCSRGAVHLDGLNLLSLLKSVGDELPGRGVGEVEVECRLRVGDGEGGSSGWVASEVFPSVASGGSSPGG